MHRLFIHTLSTSTSVWLLSLAIGACFVSWAFVATKTVQSEFLGRALDESKKGIEGRISIRCNKTVVMLAVLIVVGLVGVAVAVVKVEAAVLGVVGVVRVLAVGVGRVKVEVGVVGVQVVEVCERKNSSRESLKQAPPTSPPNKKHILNNYDNTPN